MPQLRPLILLAAPLLAAALFAGNGAIAAKARHAAHATSAEPGATAKLYNASGVESGSVELRPGADGLAGVVHVTGISPGSHGIHIHTTGKCDAPDFTTAGGHLNPEGKKHGLLNPLGSHEGDLPDLIVGADGTGTGSFTAHTSLAALFDADGAAFIVHAAPDDGKTDPSGNSGGRILCGVLEKTGK